MFCPPLSHPQPFSFPEGMVNLPLVSKHFVGDNVGAAVGAGERYVGLYDGFLGATLGVLPVGDDDGVVKVGGGVGGGVGEVVGEVVGAVVGERVGAVVGAVVGEGVGTLSQ